MLTNEIPWVMAPATLIAAILVITLISVLTKHAEGTFRGGLIAILLALTAGATIYQSFN
jgi:hypothetical protein